MKPVRKACPAMIIFHGTNIAHYLPSNKLLLRMNSLPPLNRKKKEYSFADDQKVL